MATVVTNAADLALFFTIISICSLIGVYQEFCGHSEVLLTIVSILTALLIGDVIVTSVLLIGTTIVPLPVMMWYHARLKKMYYR